MFPRTQAGDIRNMNEPQNRSNIRDNWQYGLAHEAQQRMRIQGMLDDYRIPLITMPCDRTDHADIHLLRADLTLVAAVEVKSSREGSRSWQTPHFYPSSVGQCKRQQWTYERYGVPLFYRVQIDDVRWAWGTKPEPIGWNQPHQLTDVYLDQQVMVLLESLRR